MPNRFKVGDIVKRSAASLEPQRQSWLRLGDYIWKNSCKREWERQRDERGTVTRVLSGQGIEVLLANGRTHQALDYMWELAEPMAQKEAR